MFQISLTNILVAYLFITLVVLFGVWLAKDWVRKRREKKDRKYRLVCNICGEQYEDRSRDDIPPCPSCGALNERVWLSDL
ncbi:MAG: hypothetical protein VYC05_07135 [Verrucomicrobiota bacterium]|nr:hypothetical protein [Verrucomicrobiota bacterium]